jgi:hypothetical protein
VQGEFSEPAFAGRKRKAKRRRSRSTVSRYLSALSHVYRRTRGEVHLEVVNVVRDVARMQGSKA